MVAKGNVEVSTRMTYEEREAMYMKGKQEAMNKALEGERVRYTSAGDSEKFVTFLEGRLEIWDELKDKTFHGTRMYEKTKEILESKRFGVE
ncbi:hypothetical protein MPWG_00033 [Micromonas pusilla virus PL1]|nr:hypothetical protein MPWG_00033 [Micromonas pusilla virus PL1]